MSLYEHSPENSVRLPKIGIDIGRVIIGGEARLSEQTLFGNDPLNAPEIPGAIDSIASLSRDPQWGGVVLVSKCTPHIEARTADWLATHNFHTRTDVPIENVIFCREIKDKVPIAAALGLTHFIDDRIAVLHQMHGIVPVRLLFGHQRYEHRQKGITPVLNWEQAMEELNKTKTLE